MVSGRLWRDWEELRRYSKIYSHPIFPLIGFEVDVKNQDPNSLGYMLTLTRCILTGMGKILTLYFTDLSANNRTWIV